MAVAEGARCWPSAPLLRVEVRSLKDTVQLHDKRLTDMENALTALSERPRNEVDSFCPTVAYPPGIDELPQTSALHSQPRPNDPLVLNDPWATFHAGTSVAPGDRANRVQNATAGVPRRYVQPPGSHEKDRIPYSERTEGIIGNLGWDLPGDVLLQNAWKLIAVCGYGPEAVLSAIPTYTIPGSSVNIKCASAEVLRNLKTRIDAKKMVFRSDAGARPAWCNCSKSRDELRPSRLVRKAADFLRDLEQQRASVDESNNCSAEVVSDTKGKIVELKGVGRMGATQGGNWFWFPAAYLRFAKESLLVGQDWINSE